MVYSALAGLETSLHQMRDRAATLQEAGASEEKVLAAVAENALIPPIITDLALCQQQEDRSAIAVGDGVELGVEPASGASDSPRKSPPPQFHRPFSYA